MMEICADLHQLFNRLKRFQFPFKANQIPTNGVYIIFENGERAHKVDRIVRIGTHTGEQQLRARINQHFLKENKDRSIFRKNIGRCLLNIKADTFLSQWNQDLTSREAKEKFSHLIDFDKQKKVERQVTEYIQNNLSFVVFPIESKEKRLSLESKIISTVSLCHECRPSKSWLGLNSSTAKIRESGLWLVNELYKEPLAEEEVEVIKNFCFR